jgi:predicted nucleic acid-binding protein
MALVLDTGPLYAALDRRDADHFACRRLNEDAPEPLLVPAPVLVEVDYWIRKWLGVRVLTAFLDDVTAGAYQIENLAAGDYLRIRQICHRYADSDIGFVDAAVLAVVERLQEPKLVTLDRRHFGLLRPRHVDALRLLPE